MNKQSLLYTVIFTFAICFVFVFILAAVNEATIERVEQNRIVAQQRAILSAMGFSFETDDEILSLFDDVETTEVDGRTYYETTRDGRRILASEFSGQGLWGTIRSVVAMEEGFEKIAGLEIIEHNETPGLGGRVTEREFRAQFLDLPVREGGISVVSNPTGESEVEAITGATQTSNSVERIVNSAIETFRRSFADA